jgi:hypothetical protein
MKLSSAIEALASSGGTVEQILALVRAHEAEADIVRAGRRKKDAERKAKSRMSRDVTVTSRDIADKAQPQELFEDLPKLQRRKPEAPTSAQIAAWFDRFWQAYPARKGNPKQPAFVKFEAKVKGGADPEQIIDGARRYADAMRGEDSQFVAHAATWLNQERWSTDYDNVGTKSKDIGKHSARLRVFAEEYQAAQDRERRNGAFRGAAGPNASTDREPRYVDFDHPA